MSQQAPRSQAELEAALMAKAAALSAQPASPDATVADVYGAPEAWTLELGQCKLFLDPLMRQWYVHDVIHDTWEPTGFGPGEVAFSSEQGRLGYRRLPPRLESCPDCGRRLPPSSHFCPQCGRQFSEIKLRCTNCRHDNRPDAGYCTKCGRPLHQRTLRG